MTHEHDHEHDHSHEHEPRYFFGVIPVLLVDDVVASAEYYRDVLGFDVDFIYGDPPAYASVSRNDAIINLSKSEPPGRRNSVAAAGPGNGVDIYIVVSDVDEVFEELRSHGARVLVEPVSLAYGMREFHVEDPNGYRLALAEETEDDEPA
jgi:uncharacterized glyoxalase superfamily protein PhnB